MTKPSNGAWHCVLIITGKFIANGINDKGAVAFGGNISPDESKAVGDILLHHFVVDIQDGLVHRNQKVVQVLSHEFLHVAD